MSCTTVRRTANKDLVVGIGPQIGTGPQMLAVEVLIISESVIFAPHVRTGGKRVNSNSWIKSWRLVMCRRRWSAPANDSSRVHSRPPSIAGPRRIPLAVGDRISSCEISKFLNFTI